MHDEASDACDRYFDNSHRAEVCENDMEFRQVWNV